jgi:hypothetical protein
MFIPFSLLIYLKPLRNLWGFDNRVLARFFPNLGHSPLFFSKPGSYIPNSVTLSPFPGYYYLISYILGSSFMGLSQKRTTAMGAVTLYIGEHGAGVCDFSETVSSGDLSAFAQPGNSSLTPTIRFFENLYLQYRWDSTSRDFEVSVFQSYFLFDPARRPELEKELKAVGYTIHTPPLRPIL